VGIIEIRWRYTDGHKFRIRKHADDPYHILALIGPHSTAIKYTEALNHKYTAQKFEPALQYNIAGNNNVDIILIETFVQSE
jgi:methionine synthase I (cobalamin-dependent)